MRILSLVTSDHATFYKHEVELLRESGVDVTTISPPGQRNRGLRAYLGTYPELLVESFDAYDLIHANYGLTAPLALAQPNLPVVLSLWGSDLMGRYGPVSKACARFCDAVVVMSDEMAAELDQECTVIPHGVNLDLFEPQSRAAARERLGWNDEAYHVLFPYRPSKPLKDFDRARRVATAADERTDRRVVLQTVDYVRHTEMPIYMNAADALLFTSKREGSPNVVKEALACNLPIVSTDVGDVTERLAGVTHSTVCHSDEALVDSLVAVLESGERSNGREAVRDLSSRACTDRLLSVFASVTDAEVPDRSARRTVEP